MFFSLFFPAGRWGTGWPEPRSPQHSHNRGVWTRVQPQVNTRGRDKHNPRAKGCVQESAARLISLLPFVSLVSSIWRKSLGEHMLEPASSCLLLLPHASKSWAMWEEKGQPRDRPVPRRICGISTVPGQSGEKCHFTGSEPSVESLAGVNLTRFMSMRVF